MSNLPISPRWKDYRGGKRHLQIKMVERNKTATRIVDYLNTLIANNPEEIQVYMFAFLANDLGLETNEVREAIPGGGSNGITIRVTEEDRRNLVRFKRSK